MAQKTLKKEKIIRDSIHGNIKLKGMSLDLMELPEFQRLNNIRQLGFTYLVFPGANHTRLEHSLGTFYIAQRMAESLDIESSAFTAAALLHDIGHGPFSHTLECIEHGRTGKSHIALTGEVITGEKKIADVEEENIKTILEKHGVDVREIVSILYGEKGYLSELIHGSIDADQIDYLMRDAYYTGVAYGIIDAQRILQTIKIHKGNVAVERKGLSAIESMLVARSLMYSSVYLHKTVRIAELMLVRAVERAPKFDFSCMTDSELLEYLKHIGSFQQDIIHRLKYRILFKKAYAKNFSELKPREKEHIAEMADLGELEFQIAQKVGIDEGYIIVDLPGRDILISEPRLRKIDINIFDEGHLKPLGEFTPLANALQIKGVTEWTIMVCCPEEVREKVATVAEKVLQA
jgi:HD superfamily phosphohydrolase